MEGKHKQLEKRRQPELPHQMAGFPDSLLPTPYSLLPTPYAPPNKPSRTTKSGMNININKKPSIRKYHSINQITALIENSRTSSYLGKSSAQHEKKKWPHQTTIGTTRAVASPEIWSYYGSHRTTTTTTTTTLQHHHISHVNLTSGVGGLELGILFRGVYVLSLM